MTQGHGVIARGMVKRIQLAGTELHIIVEAVNDEFCAVKYPDNHVRHHQVKDVPDLLTKISGQLKNRYNLDSFEFETVPDAVKPCDIKIGGIHYGA